MTLQAGDLTDLVDSTLQIDSYRSKMGDDADVVVLSFDVKDKTAAMDLVSFIEKGYRVVLDADFATVEDEKYDFKVYIELDRDETVIDNVLEILDGVGKLSGIAEFHFQYYKSFKPYKVNLKTLKKHVPVSKEKYNEIVTESNMNNFKNFFNKSYLEEVTLVDDVLTLKKIWADPISFKVLEFADREELMNSLTESFNFNDFAEIIFLCKYIGDYNITKYGNKLVFENNGKSLLLTRI
jgi:hypothetical protein